MATQANVRRIALSLPGVEEAADRFALSVANKGKLKGFVCPPILAIPVTNVSATVRVVRLSFDQRTLNAWNEIDAVKLIGTR